MQPKLENLKNTLESSIRKAEYAKSFAEIMKIFVAMKEANVKERSELLATIKEKINDLETRFTGHSSSMTAEMKALEKKSMDYCMKEMKKMEKEQADNLNFIRDKAREHKQECEDEHEQMMSDMKAMIPEMPKIPETFNPEMLENEINDLKKENEEQQKEIEELKKRPLGRSGGGVSAMGVAQAFKYIAHTEEPSGLINGVNTTYTVKNAIWWIAGFTLNGEQIAELPNYTYSGHTITFSTALPAAYANKDIECKYIGM